MKVRHDNCGWVGILVAMAVLASARSVQGQVGQGVNLPSSFATPITSFGYLGGRYSNSVYGGFSFSPSSDTGVGGPLSGGLGAPMTGARPASRGLEGGPQGLMSLRSLPSPVSTLRPLAPIGLPEAYPLGYPLPSSVPDYTLTQIPRRYRVFNPSIEPDTFSGLPGHRPAINLKNVTPNGPGASAVQSKPLALPVSSEEKLDALKEMSERKEAKLSSDGAAALQKAMQALKEGNLRGDRANPGAVDLFRRARLLAGQQPEPTLGSIASLVMTSDYNQAAVLIGPLLRKWPEVMANTDFAQVYYARPEQMRMHLLSIREAAIARGDPDLRLLWAFYRWYAESRQQAIGDADQLARLAGPDSPAAAMAEAMRAALASGG